jgi:hypothetical protein
MASAAHPPVMTTELSTTRQPDHVTDSRRRPSVRSRAAALHYISLGAAVLFLLWVDREQWFSGDEWDLLVNRGVIGHHGLDLWEPHNEHWSTLPILMYRALFSVFGVRTYLPYLLVLVGIQVVVAHLLWRLMLRVGVEPMVATVASATFAVLGAGWEILINAFNFTFMMPIAFGFLALLLMPERGPFQRRDAYGWLCNVIGLLCSGVAVTMVLVVGLTAFLRRGWRVAVLTISVPGLVYLTWFAVRGRHARSIDQQPLTTALGRAPAFVWRGLADAVESGTGFPGMGPLVLVVILVPLAIWIVRSARPSTPSWSIVLATALGAPMFLFLVDIRRSGLGVAAAGASRYSYVVLALLAPILALAVTALLARSQYRPYVLFAATLVLILVCISTLIEHADQNAIFKQENKHRIIAAAGLLRSGAPTLSDTPAPQFDPDLGSRQLIALARDGKLPGNVHITESDRLTAAEYLQLTLRSRRARRVTSQAQIVGAEGAELAPAPEPGCLEVSGTSDRPTMILAFPAPGSVRITTTRSGVLTAQLQSPGGVSRGRGRAWSVVKGSPRVLSVAATKPQLRLGVPPGNTTEMCGVSGSP